MTRVCKFAHIYCNYSLPDFDLRLITALEKCAGHMCDYLLHMEILGHGTLTFPRLFSHYPSPPLVHMELEIPRIPDNHALSCLMLMHISSHLPSPTLTALPQGKTNSPSNSLQQPSTKLLWVTSERGRLHSHGTHTPLVLGNTLLCPTPHWSSPSLFLVFLS